MIVAEYEMSGSTVKIADDAYKGKTAEELARIRRNAERLAWQIAKDAMLRERETETEERK